MLYNKNWDAKTITSDPLTIGSLIEWLEKQPANETYCYHESGRCLLTQYLTAKGFVCVHVNPWEFRHDGAPGYTPLPSGFDDIACGDIVDGSEWTFGHALERAHKAVA